MHNSSLLNTSPQQKALIIFTVMCVAILEILDSTIINVALPHMMPSLSANQNQITWVLTSYVIASAMMIPLTGFLTRRFGERNILLINLSIKAQKNKLIVKLQPKSLVKKTRS